MDRMTKDISSELLFTSADVLKKANVTYRQLSHWELKGIVKSTCKKLGTRDFKRYTQQDIDTLRAVKRLLDEGYALPAADTLKEITLRKETEEALQESEKKYRQLVETLQEGIWAIDKDANTTFANLRMAEMLGYTVEEMLGKSLFNFMDERGVEIAKYTMKRRKQGIAGQHDFEFLRKDGSLIYTILETSFLTDEKGNFVGALAGVIDITERKKAEEKQIIRFEILKCFHKQSSFKSMCEKVVSLIKKCLSCEVAALRLKEGEYYRAQPPAVLVINTDTSLSH